MILSVHVVAIILFIYYVAMHFFHCQVYGILPLFIHVVRLRNCTAYDNATAY